jgi:hypothetical protein
MPAPQCSRLPPAPRPNAPLILSSSSDALSPHLPLPPPFLLSLSHREFRRSLASLPPQLLPDVMSTTNPSPTQPPHFLVPLLPCPPLLTISLSLAMPLHCTTTKNRGSYNVKWTPRFRNVINSRVMNLLVFSNEAVVLMPFPTNGHLVRVFESNVGHLR